MVAVWIAFAAVFMGARFVVSPDARAAILDGDRPALVGDSVRLIPNSWIDQNARSMDT